MKTSKKGMLGLIGAIAVFAIVSVCFSNCSSEDDFGEMEEMEYTMASKKMTRAGEAPAPFIGIPIVHGTDTLYDNLYGIECYFVLTWGDGYISNTAIENISTVGVSPYSTPDLFNDKYIDFLYCYAAWNRNYDIDVHIQYQIRNSNHDILTPIRKAYYVHDAQYEIDTLSNK